MGIRAGNGQLAAKANLAGSTFAIVSPMHAETAAVRYEPDLGTSELGDLLRGVAAKDRTAFEAFYEATVERALGLAMRITQQMELAEEVVSDVYMQVWRQADRFDQSRGNAMAWLSIICRSRALDSMRKANSARTTEAAIDEVSEVEFENHPQNLLAATERHSAVHAALAQLQPDERHQHETDELCIVLEGDVSFDDIHLEAGDYHYARAGSWHGQASTRNGALIFLQAGVAA